MVSYDIITDLIEIGDKDKLRFSDSLQHSISKEDAERLRRCVLNNAKFRDLRKAITSEDIEVLKRD